MTNPPMQSRHTEFSRRTVRWLWPTALLALAPKCVLCVLAYAGLGASIGLSGPEICGATAGSPDSWATALAWLGVGGALGALGVHAGRRCGRSAHPQPHA
jgi:hypothetical protein